MNKQNQIMINGNQFSFEPGQTILEVARRHDIDIPTLCHLKRAVPSGSCRICVVEVENTPDLVTACATSAADNMVVYTESPSVIASRRATLQLLLSSGNHNCAISNNTGEDWTEFQLRVHQEDQSSELCPVWGDCRLQDLAYRYQVSGDRSQGKESPYPMETVNPFIVRDFSRCILCGRCVQACNQIQVNDAIDFGHRDAETKIVTTGDRPLKDSDCVFCGECVQACPVGALVEKDVRYNVRHWDTQKVRTTCSYCGVGCQLYLHVKDDRVVKVTGVEETAPNFGSLCVKGRFGFHFVHSPERLTTPLIKTDGKFRKATWEEATQLVADKLNQIKKDHGADSIGVLTSARITNEENYIAHKFTRAVLKTNNIDHCARLCHSSTVAGLAAAFGSGAMTNTIADIEKADVILVTGSNTTENHPVLSSVVKRAVKFRGARLIVVDPRRIKLVDYADKWLRPNLGTDVAWINGLMNVIIQEKLYDKAFVADRTSGFEALRKIVEKYTPEFVESITGIPASDLMEAARMYAGAKPGSILYCMGITQHTTGTDNVKSLANLAMLCGHMGVEGGGVNPLRGQNNVQGACDMGGLPNVFSGYQPVTNAEVRKKLEEKWGVNGMSDKPGLTATQMVPQAHEGKLKAFYIIGENPLMSDPDLHHAEKSFAHLDFLVVQDIFMTETAKMAHVVLPSSCFAEKDGTFSNTERRVQRVRRAVTPPGQARSDWEILCDVATRMGYPLSYENSQAIFQEIASVTPSYGGITYDRIERVGLHWPCPTADHPGTPILHIGQFPIGKGVFHAIEYIPPNELADDEYPLYLTTGRILYHYHTGTMTRKTEGLNDRAPENFVEISEQDAATYQIEDGVDIRIASRRGNIVAKAKISPMAVTGTVFIPFHFAEAAANILTNAALDPVSKIPEYKVCAVNLSRAA